MEKKYEKEKKAAMGWPLLEAHCARLKQLCHVPTNVVHVRNGLPSMKQPGLGTEDTRDNLRK